MRDFLLRMYFYLKRLPGEHPLSAAVAVALALLEGDDFLALKARLQPGSPAVEELKHSLLDEQGEVATAVGAALTQQLEGRGGVVVAPLEEEALTGGEGAKLIALALERQLPLILLVACDAEKDVELAASDTEDELERIQADGQDAMRLMPALRLAIDKAREGDGPTLIECVCGLNGDEETPAAAERLYEVLISEGYATPEELI